MTKEEKQQYYVLILEDDPDTQQHIQKVVKGFGYQIAGAAASYNEAMAIAETSFPHVALCDITIEGEKNGIDVAKALQAMGNLAIIYLTMHSNEVIVEEALSTNPESYLLKNSIIVKADQLDIEIQKTVRNLSKNKISFKSRGIWYEIDYQDILYVEADNNNCNIVTTQKVFNLNQKFGEVLDKLKKYRIQKIHRSVAINMQHVSTYDKKMVHLDLTKLASDFDVREKAEVKGELKVSDSCKQAVEKALGMG